MAFNDFRSAKFWSNVEALMKDRGTTPSTLSLSIGTTQNYIVNAMRYKGVPNIATALAIAHFYGVTIEELAYGNLVLSLKRKRLLAVLEEVNRELAEIEKEA